ncbi:uncharacterized protein PAE49_003988 isoform 1-T2 [Odontesthes bonariensis]|uniref:uncharacterized protein LOC142379422 n=1 Tax=Odontesthes bonariensis TaxID=219752 RepID=UPI003F586ECF
MERNKKTPFFFLLLPLLQVCTTRGEGCPSLPDKNLTCYNDFSQNITCFWNSTTVSDHMDRVCTIHAQKVSPSKNPYSASCTLQPVDPSKPAIRKCSLIFQTTYIFLKYHILSINLSCIPPEKSQIISYRPNCHVKVNPPSKPYVNSTIVSWFTQDSTHQRIKFYNSQLQWKQKDQSWSDPSVQKKSIPCKWSCEAQLDPDLLVKGETYEARVRVQSILNDSHGTWSDWSPSESWMSRVGGTKPPGVDIMKLSLAGLGVFCLFLVVIFSKTDKTLWVYIVKRITSPPLPDPAKTHLFQTWLTPHFTSESFHSYFKPVEIASVEVTTTVDAVTPCRPGVKMMTDKRKYESTNSSFSSPSYSECCSPPVSSLTAGNLEPCAADSSYGPVCGQGEGKNKGHDSDVVAEKNIEILQLFSKCSRSSESLQVISDYEKFEKVQFQKVHLERLRLPSVDSGMCSCEEVSQESMEVDSINVTDEGTQDKDEKEGGDGKHLSFQRLFGSSEGDFAKECIEVSFDYNLIPKLQADSPELPSLESGINSSGEERESQEESMEDEDKSIESTRFLFPPHPSTFLPCSLLSLSKQSFNSSGLDLSPALQPLPSPGMFERFALMSESSLMEPSDDGYMPVRKEQS